MKTTKTAIKTTAKTTKTAKAPKTKAAVPAVSPEPVVAQEEPKEPETAPGPSEAAQPQEDGKKTKKNGKKTKGVGAYPFPTKREIAARLEADDQYVAQCLQAMQARTVARSGQRRYGWMSSHQSQGKLLAMAADRGLLGGYKGEEEMARARRMLAGYTRQLAEIERERAIAERPELAAAAATYFMSTQQSQSKPKAGPLQALVDALAMRGVDLPSDATESVAHCADAIVAMIS
jgi:hypothetical protein